MFKCFVKAIKKTVKTVKTIVRVVSKALERTVDSIIENEVEMAKAKTEAAKTAFDVTEAFVANNRLVAFVGFTALGLGLGTFFAAMYVCHAPCCNKMEVI